MPTVNWYWFQVHYGPRSEIVAYTGTSLNAVLDRIAAAQAGRPGPRITRIAALSQPPLDAATIAFLDECIRLEQNGVRAHSDF